MKSLILILPLIFSTSLRKEVSFEVLNVGTDANLIALSATPKSLWVSGTKGTILKSLDLGNTWSGNLWTGADSLQFRDIHAFDSNRAVTMSIGSGASSQIFLTQDGGANWSRTYQMDHPEGFLDCMDFWDDQFGVAYGDSFDGYPFILRTSDSGESWERVLSENLPGALEGESGFASSGTCIKTGKDGLAWIGTGNAAKARVLLSKDYGKSWDFVDTPLVSGEASGITSIDFLEDGTGVVTGGDLTKMAAYTDNCAISKDFGKSWQLTSHPNTEGALYGSSFSRLESDNVLFVCGPNGIDYSYDEGSSWTTLDTSNYWTVYVDSGRSIGWAAGKNGHLIRINLE
ncbi:MAG: oxidoreductase [Bacteroidota bacterium]